MKLRSSATLFASVSAAGSVFEQLLDRYGERDDRTLRLLEGNLPNGGDPETVEATIDETQTYPPIP